jgi:RimJ/RimL family protein N-acetyltransferase
MPLEGERVILREEQAGDVALLAAMRNDLETQAWSRVLPPDFTHEMYMQRHSSREFSFDRWDGRFIVIDKATGEVAGYTGFYGVQPRWSGIIGWALLKEFWGSGLAREINEVLLEFLFLQHGLRVVRAYTTSDNVRAIGLCEKLGFQSSGRVREGVYRHGVLADTVILDILRDEFFALRPHLTDTLPPYE